MTEIRTSPFAEALAAAGATIELPIAEKGTRGCAVGRSSAGTRVLLTVVGPKLPPAARREHDGWDLPLHSVEELDTASGPRTLIVEALGAGVPSIEVSAGRGAAAPPFVLAFAERIARAHEQRRVVGWLHPALVFVEPATMELVAVAQRPIRAAFAAPAGPGSLPLFGLEYAAPADVRNRPAVAADDVHRLAALTWRWRHGAGPFDGLTEAELLHRLAGTPLPEMGGSRAGSRAPAPVDEPTDDLDELLASALDPSARDRPSAADLLGAFAAAGPAWQVRRPSA